MPTKRRGSTDRGHLLAFVVLALLALALLLLPLRARPAQAQGEYSYDSFHTELTINADGTLLARNKVSYAFAGTSVKVGLFVPSSYGELIEARVLGGDGEPLPEGAWGYEGREGGHTLWCDGAGAAAATFTYEYLLDRAFTNSGDLIGLREWAAVPESRGSGIKETSVSLRFPPGADPSTISLTALPSHYSGQITSRFVGSDTAVIEAAFLDADSSYSIDCYWPPALMDEGMLAQPVPGGKSWEFERFDTDITLHADSSFTVRETQVVNFRGAFSFLDRDLSTLAASGFDGRTYGRVRIRDVAVFDLDGNPYDRNLWSVKGHDGGVTVHIEFEARDEQRGWVISYRMTGATIFAPEYDRLYWNAVSDDRDVPIHAAAISLHLPPGAEAETVRAAQYVDISNPPSAYDSGVSNGSLWWSASDIPPHTTFTIDVAMPKGAVAVPWQYGRACGLVLASASALLLAAALAGMVLLWWKKGRDAGGGASAMVRYEPPEGLTPALVGMLVNQKPRVQDISATIVDLARRGYLTIIEEESRKLIRVKKFAFQRGTGDLSALLPYERKIMDGLFASGDRVGEKDLENSFYVHIDAILKDGVRKEAGKRGLFKRDPVEVRARYLTAGILAAALPLAALFALPAWFDLGWFALPLLTFIPVGAIVALVGRAMPSRSAEGSRAYGEAMGFREYMATAERQEMDFMTPENFQANLPFAMVLGVTDKWARNFRDIYTTPPQWYSGGGTSFGAVYLASSLSDMTGRMNRTLTSSPRSSGSGGGGFGGGSSGGGFGGGGSSAG